METTKQWRDIFNSKKDLTENKTENKKQSNFMIINDIIKSNNNGMYVIEKIPQSVIKKSIKDAYKK